MSWWIYKCNNRQHDHQIAYGDWSEFFAEDATSMWGSDRWVPALLRLVPGDLVIAYQTDRNELVGITRVAYFEQIGEHNNLYLEPLEEIRVKVRPLKKRYRNVARIPALQSGPIKTIYEISERDARNLLRASGSELAASVDDESESESELTFIEGERRASTTTIRNAALRIHAKKRWGTACYCCGFDFGTFYSDIASGVAIVHHLDPISTANGTPRSSTTNDVRVVCANCHHVLHLEDPPMDVTALRRKLSRRWTRWTENGVQSKR
jgi:predicted HNH restriction endonuclease